MASLYASKPQTALAQPACNLLPASVRPARPFVASQQPAQRVVIAAATAKGFGGNKPAPQNVKKADAPPPCPCESGRAYKNCCESALTTDTPAATPEATLRARFAAFSKGNIDYLLATTHRDYHQYQYYKPEADEEVKRDYTTGINKYLYAGLKIVQVEPGSVEDEGFVSFEYLSTKRENGLKTKMWDKTAEKCRFLRVNGVWQFVDYQRATFAADSIMNATSPPASS